MVARIVKARLILPQANSLCYKVGATSVNLFWDFTITYLTIDSLGNSVRVHVDPRFNI